MIKRVLVGLDGSSESKTAFEQAASIALRGDGELVGAAVLDEPGMRQSLGPAPMGAYYHDKGAVEARQAEKLKGILEEFGRDCRKLG